MIVCGSALLARKISSETGLQARFAECLLPVFADGVSRQDQVRVLDSWWQLGTPHRAVWALAPQSTQGPASGQLLRTFVPGKVRWTLCPSLTLSVSPLWSGENSGTQNSAWIVLPQGTPHQPGEVGITVPCQSLVVASL